MDVKSDGDGIILESFGNFEDLLKDEKYRGGTFEEIVSDGKRTYSAPKIKENVSQRKKVNMSMLFGPGKPAGPPCLVKVKQRFSHRRVFGHKGEASQSANQKA